MKDNCYNYFTLYIITIYHLCFKYTGFFFAKSLIDFVELWFKIDASN